MSWILLTNDDGPDSPALAPFAKALAGLSEIRVVIPREERSWVAKAITRFEPVFVEKVERDGVEVWLCSGYPADGVQLGLHGLFDDPPELVISGINLGFNHGVGYIMSSGTVGAAVEAWVSGVPSLAFSTGAMTEWDAWRTFARSPDASPDWLRLSDPCAALAKRLIDSGLVRLADVVSVNVPFDATTDTPVRVTTIARVGYDRLFRQDGPGRFVHAFGGGFREFDALEGSDIDAAHRGWISVTPIRMPAAATVPERIRALLERG